MSTFTDLFAGGALGAEWSSPAISAYNATPAVGGGVASGNGSSARLVIATDSGIQTITLVVPTRPADYSGVGALFLDGSTQNGYSFYCQAEPGTGVQAFWSRSDAGTLIGLGSTFLDVPTHPATYTFTYNPATDTFGVDINGATWAPGSNSAYTNLTRAGFFVGGTATIDSFSADPIVSGVILPRVDYSKVLKLALLGIK